MTGATFRRCSLTPRCTPRALYSGGPTAVDTYRPVTLATFMWDASLSGAAPWAYHLTNLLAHLCCVWLVQRLACVMLPEADRAFAWVGAAWFALSPLPAEAHVWINGRSDIFTTLFGLLAVLAWRRALAAVRGKALAWHIAATVSFLCGLLSKEVLLLCIPRTRVLAGAPAHASRSPLAADCAVRSRRGRVPGYACARAGRDANPRQRRAAANWRSSGCRGS